MKRFFDIGFSLLALGLLLIPFLLIAIAIKATSRGPIGFTQERIGAFGKPFRILKFRTMVENAAVLGGYETYETDPRITRVGRFLRRFSLDEYPQFWNVLKGEMSLVGPRPTLRYQVEAYTPRQKRRLLIKPGITGLAQISGRNRLDWPERIELDLKYIQTFSLWKDLKILIKTVFILPGKGVY